MDDDTEDNDNETIINRPFGVIQGGKPEFEPMIPTYDYVVIDIEEHEFEINGFVVFTPQHLAIMRDDGQGPLPILVMPMARVKVVALASAFPDVDDDED